MGMGGMMESKRTLVHHTGRAIVRVGGSYFRLSGLKINFFRKCVICVIYELCELRVANLGNLVILKNTVFFVFFVLFWSKFRLTSDP